jgi:hypothetical protein
VNVLCPELELIIKYNLRKNTEAFVPSLIFVISIYKCFATSFLIRVATDEIVWFWVHIADVWHFHITRLVWHT